MIYSHTNDDIFCAFYAGSSTEIPLEAGNITLKQETNYPFEGNIKIQVEPANNDTEFTLWLRIPTWCSDQFVPGNLYKYADNSKQQITASVNGQKVKSDIQDGYMPIRRKWKAGDQVELNLPMEVRYSVADERVEADIDRICITRGPLVYCAEQPDNQYTASNYIIGNINQSGEMATFMDGIMKGIPSIRLNASAIDDNQEKNAVLKLIPYYAWNNRGDNTTMNVWFARNAETVLKAIANEKQ